jgi:Cu+-exporting ATPase
VLLYLASAGAQETAEGLPIDPVCHMAVDPDRAAGMLVHEGTRYLFCSLHCARRFATEPERFV